MTARFASQAIASLAALAILAGCAAGSPAGSGAPAGRSPAAKGSAVLRIHVPKHNPRPAGKRARYISPATKAMSYVISGPTPASGTVDLTPTATGCSSGVTGTDCALTLTLSAGDYTATISTYDSTDIATAHTLSTAQAVPFTVVAGTSNAISLSLSGVPAKLLIAPSSAITVQSPSGSLDLLGTASRKLLVEAIDADGGFIVGVGSPTFTISQTAGQLDVTITQPGTTAPNFFSIQPPAAYSTKTATLSVAASYSGQATDGCAVSGAVCTATVIVDMKEVLAVGNSSGETISLYELPLTTPYATIANVNVPSQGMAFDTSGDLFLANCQTCTGGSGSGDDVLEYAPPYSTAETTISTGVTNPVALVLDASRDVFVANGSANTVTEYSSPYSSAAVTLATGVSGPSAIALDSTLPQPDLFVANNTGNDIAAWTPPYSVAGPSLTISSSVSSPTALAFDPSGNLLVINCPVCTAPGTGTLTEYAFPQSNSQAVTRSFTNSSGSGGILDEPGFTLAFDANGDMFVPSRGNTGGASPKVIDFNAPFFNNETANPSITNSISAPIAVTVDGSNDVFVANSASVTVYAANYTGAPFLTIANGVDAPIALAILP